MIVKPNKNERPSESVRSRLDVSIRCSITPSRRSTIVLASGLRGQPSSELSLSPSTERDNRRQSPERTDQCFRLYGNSSGRHSSVRSIPGLDSFPGVLRSSNSYAKNRNPSKC